MHTCIPLYGLKRSWHSCSRRVNANNRNTPSMHHPRRRNVTTSMAALKKFSYTKSYFPTDFLSVFCAYHLFAWLFLSGLLRQTLQYSRFIPSIKHLFFWFLFVCLFVFCLYLYLWFSAWCFGAFLFVCAYFFCQASSFLVFFSACYSHVFLYFKLIVMVFSCLVVFDDSVRVL